MLRIIAVLTVVAALGTASCSSDDGDEHADEKGADDAEPVGEARIEVRKDGPAAEVTGVIDGGRGPSLLAARQLPDLEAAGYSETEYRVAGTATSYRTDGELPSDGTYDLKPAATAEYATRIVVRRPVAGKDFNGTVVVEWLNVSGGAEFAPDYTYLADEILRRGYAWVGVSAQHIGIEGGPVAVQAPGGEITGAGKGLRTHDPERYGDLSHPGDAFSYDIFTQVGSALRESGPAGSPTYGLDVERLLAVGESQSGFALATYVNGVQPLTHQFDGFLIHSRGSAAAPLGEPGAGIDIGGTIGGQPTTIRTDLAVPVITVETETDLLGVINFLPARQPDSAYFRLWEVAGTAHADSYQIESIESLLECAQPINRGQQHVVLKAALRHLDTWADGGDAPPEADRLEVDETGDQPAFVRDEDGNVKGGIRTPAVEAPVDVLSGEAAPGSSTICLLMGSTTPLPADRIAALYPSLEAYLDAYDEATDAAVDAGFVLEEDRRAILDEVDLGRVPR
jgi:hypothetical protein